MSQSIPRENLSWESRKVHTVERQPLKANKEPYIQEHSFYPKHQTFLCRESGGYSAWERFLAQMLGLNKEAQRPR